MALTEDDLKSKRDRVAKLREQIADAEAKQAAALQEKSLEIEAASLDAETARLEAQLAPAKEAAKASNIKSGSAAPLAAMTEQLEAAKASVTAPGTTVDTNDESSAASEDKNGGNK